MACLCWELTELGGARYAIFDHTKFKNCAGLSINLLKSEGAASAFFRLKRVWQGGTFLSLFWEAFALRFFSRGLSFGLGAKLKDSSKDFYLRSGEDARVTRRIPVGDSRLVVRLQIAGDVVGSYLNYFCLG